MELSYLEKEIISGSVLPLSRDERFYTTTVFPSLLFDNNLFLFYEFLNEIKSFPDEVNGENTKTSFIFYTEYNMKKNAGEKSIGATIPITSNAIPDAIIEILEPTRQFIIIEAKMFRYITQNKFDKEMQRQRQAVIEALIRHYHLSESQFFHLALIPEKLGFIDRDDYQVINWEFFCNYEKQLKDNYFYKFLILALRYYDDLVEGTNKKGSTYIGQKRGEVIYDDGHGEKEFWVGISGGEGTIKKHIEEKLWKNKWYCYNITKPEGGQKGNWMSSERFAQIVDEYNDKKQSSVYNCQREK
jgi:hypothetical protein